ncbi:hypothetical protein RI129_004086 [Pyrocoelia pectoralis]|uniref:Cadherin domain-containing protein n=1 Tax=Pyrocoelia pectoralis TaxID=417401 RepID=A0AAN7ZK72_9COLE
MGLKRNVWKMEKDSMKKLGDGPEERSLTLPHFIQEDRKLGFCVARGKGKDLLKARRNCELEGVSPDDWTTEYQNTKVNDNESKEFKRFKAANVAAVNISESVYEKYFLVTLEEDTVIISPSAEFKNIETNENSGTLLPTIIVNLIFKCEEGSGILVFYQPINDLNTYEPHFRKDSYSYTVPMPLPPNFDMSCLFGEHIEACDNDITNTALSFTISPPEDFSLDWQTTTDGTKKCHRAVIKTLQSLSLSGPKDYILSATDTGTPTKTGMAQLRIEVNKEESIPANPQFTSAYYTAHYNIEHDLHTVNFDSTVTLERNDQPVTYSLEGAHKDNFDLEPTSEGLKVNLITNLPDDVIRDDVIVLLTVKATTEKAEAPGRTVLVIYLPKRELTTPDPTIPTISFEKEDYIFTIPPVESITVGVVRANSNTQENVQYTLHASDGATIPNQLRISESSGRLTVDEKLDIGTYKVKVIATGVSSKATDSANVVIKVVSEESTTYSVIVKEISELTEATINLPCSQTETTCVYEFDYQYPETTPPLFTVENNVLKSASIHLQMDAIKDLLVPQFIVNLKLRPTAPKLRNLTLIQNVNFEEDVHKWVLLPKHLLRESDSLLVSVIINDVNNNPPIFKEGSKLLIGYPVKKLARQLSLTHLVQVTATDADLFPINSDIRYSTDSSNFIVHPISGVIYPAETAFADNKDETFKVVAKDRAGGEDAHSTTLEVEVTLLEKNHLTVLKVANKLLEDVNGVIERLSADSNMKIGYLTASIESPSYSLSRMLRNLVMLEAPRAKPVHFLSIVIYAFNSNNEVIPTETVQSKLEGTEDINVDPWTPSTDIDTDVESTNTTGFIAAIAVLGVLLVLFMIGIGLLYYFKIRKFNRPLKPYKSMNEEDAESTKSARDESSIEDLTKRRPTGYSFNAPPPEDDDNRSDENNGYVDILDKPRDWSGASTHFSKNSNENKLDYLGKINNETAQHQHTEDEDTDDLRDQKKSVSFKPTVQKINILVDEEKQENDDNDIRERL